MCYNCGCKRPDDDMGKGHAGVNPDGKAITTKTFEAAAKAFNGSPEKAMENTAELIKETLAKK